MLKAEVRTDSGRRHSRPIAARIGTSHVGQITYQVISFPEWCQCVHFHQVECNTHRKIRSRQSVISIQESEKRNSGSPS